MKKKLQPKARVKRLPARVRIKPSRQRGVGVSTIISMLILPLLCCLSLTSKAVLIRDSTGIKDCIVKGKVVDEKGQPLPGVTVLLDSTKVGVITDVNGNFQLKLARSGGVLVFSFIGYETVKATFKAEQPLNVRMKESNVLA